MNKLYTDEQQALIFAAWRAGKSTKEIAEFYGFDLDSLRGFVSRAVAKKLIPPAPKGKRKVKPSYCKDVLMMTPQARKSADEILSKITSKLRYEDIATPYSDYRPWTRQMWNNFTYRATWMT